MAATSDITLVFVMVMDRMEKKLQALLKWGYLNLLAKQLMIIFQRLKARNNSRPQS